MDSQTTFDIITTAASGSAFGLVGSGVSKVANYIERKQSNTFQEKRWNYELYRIKAGATAPPPDSLPPRIQSTHTTRAHSVVEGVRILFRPILTIALLTMCFYIYIELNEMARMVELSSHSPFSSDIIYLDNTYGLLHYLVHAIVFSTTTSIVWWFGDRGSQPNGVNQK